VAIDLAPDCPCGYDVSACDAKWNGRYYNGGSMAAIMLTDTMDDLVARTHNGRRDARHAGRMGYEVRRFHYPSWHEDINAIHHSKETRSGGRMQGHYRDTLPPSEPMQEPRDAACMKHWRYDFGAFLEGHLVAYIGLVRTGDVATYMQIIGSGDHLASGVMYLLHFRLMEWALAGPPELDGCKAIFYTDFSGAPGVALFKRKCGFQEVRL
jgi:hypothetical protein